MPKKKEEPNKYDHKIAQPFNDPVVRCDSCQTLLSRKKIVEEGKCWQCGNRRVRNVVSFTSEERKKMEKWEVDPEYLDLFEVRYDTDL